MRKVGVRKALAVLAVMVAAAGCRSAYYSTMELFGREKRHILKSEIRNVSEAQSDAAEQFTDALTRLKAMYGLEGTDLEKVYRKLEADYLDCSARAAAVRGRVKDMEQVAADLFKEWEGEIGEISSSDLRARSEQALRGTRRRFTALDDSVSLAAARMDPVLQQLKDYVLYLKHNLNAQAVGSLRIEADRIEAQVGQLVVDIEKSVAEAQEFLKEFERQ